MFRVKLSQSELLLFQLKLNYFYGIESDFLVGHDLGNLSINILTYSGINELVLHPMGGTHDSNDALISNIYEYPRFPLIYPNLIWRKIVL